MQGHIQQLQGQLQATALSLTSVMCLIQMPTLLLVLHRLDSSAVCKVRAEGKLPRLVEEEARALPTALRLALPCPLLAYCSHRLGRSCILTHEHIESAIVRHPHSIDNCLHVSS